MSQPDNSTEARRSRRVFLTGVGVFGLTVIGAAVGLFRFLIPNIEYGKPKRFKVGMPKDFPDKTATYLPDEKLFVVREGDTFMALSAVCTHLGCTVRANNAGDGGFLCPCHGSKFLSDGTNTTGPAPKPLEAYELSLGNSGELIVDMRTLVSRKEKLHI
jgi:cytochrome b6-f complex iron-sulfur subunit